FFFSSRRRHTRFSRDWSSDVCSSDLLLELLRREWCLHALTVGLASDTLLHEEELRSPGRVPAVRRERLVEETLRVRELVGGKLRMRVEHTLFRLRPTGLEVDDDDASVG